MTDLVIFDSDGVLVDSERISNGLLAEHLCELGLETSYEDCVRDYMGRTKAATLDLIAERLGRPLPPGWVEGWDEAVRRAFEAHLEPVSGVVEALDAVEAAGLETCVASSGGHDKLRLTLGLTGLAKRFAGRIFSAQDVEQGKPAPDLFLHAAERMGAEPERCVVVEDSPLGIAAANAAGMRALGFAAALPRERLAGADIVFEQMKELPALLAARA